MSTVDQRIDSNSSSIDKPMVRDEEEYVGPFLDGKILPPLQLYPMTDDGMDLDPKTEEAILDAVVKARELLGDTLPADVIRLAVERNYAERIKEAVSSLEEYYTKERASDAYRRFFSKHEHRYPEIAAIFFDEIKKLRSIDLASAISTPDTRSLVTEMLKSLDRHFYDEIVIDDVPKVSLDVVDSEDGTSYVLVTAKKVVARRFHERGRDAMVYKRRKTYVAKLSDLENFEMSDMEAIQNSLAGSAKTPECLVSVIESVFVERPKGKILNSKR